jgi:hypothetical protein
MSYARGLLFAFYLDRYDTDDVPHRLLISGGMLAAIFLAASVCDAFVSRSAIALSACRKRVTVLSLVVIALTLGLAAFGDLLPPIAIEGGIIAILLIKVRANILRYSCDRFAKSPPVELLDRQETP